MSRTRVTSAHPGGIREDSRCEHRASGLGLTLDVLAETAFRVLFSLIFATAGLAHLVRPQIIIARLLEAPLAHLATAIAPAPFLVFSTGVVLLVAGVTLLLGFRTRLSAVLLIAVLVPMTVAVDVGHTNALGPLFKNVALLGGLIHFATKGGGAIAIDRARSRVAFLRRR